MLSFPKLVTLIVVIAAVWFGLRWLSRVERVRKQEGPKVARSATRPPAQAEDLEKCPRCTTWVSADSGPCGRPDCPYGR
ncbi:MAG TPA: hypothetical protein VEB64_08695 [Azospirillaceae bacterium]|nr:hypothetical protein [Azospirillaceae bacterium]